MKQSKRSSQQTEKFREYKPALIIDGRLLKDRTIIQASNHFQAIKATAQRFHLKRQAWFKKIESEKLSTFWGFKSPRKRSFENKLIIQVSDHSYSTKGIGQGDLKLMLDTTPDLEVPLLMTNKFWDSHRDLLEARLKSPGIPRHQPLVNEYLSLELRSKHIYSAMSMYEEILTRKVKDRYHDKLYPPHPHYGIPLTIILTIGEHIYHFSNTMNRDFQLMDGNIFYDEIKE